MNPKIWYRNNNILFYQYFISAFYLACGIYSVTAIWLTYEYTKSPFIVSIIIIAGYLPSAIAGFIFSEQYSRGNPYKKIQTATLILINIMILLVINLILVKKNVIISLVVIALIQVILSLVKLSNQSYLALLIRSIFSEKQDKQVIEISSSNLLVSLSIGAGLARLFLSIGLVYLGPSITVILLALAWMAIVKLEKQTSKLSHETITVDKNSQENSVDKILLFKDRHLQTLILFSICSSGTLQYINSILAPLANHIIANEPVYFSLLDILSMIGGFFAGIVLSSHRLKSTVVLNYGFLSITVIAILLAVTNNPSFVAILIFMLAFSTTAHIICMQVKVNQTPCKKHVSQYTALRNSSMSIAKTCFSLLSGIVTTTIGIQACWFVLAAIALGFTILWYMFITSWRE
ncbi:MFS transporter [Bartonella senegalensis]|uniref:MFS transporter n=1 Tax=Bartonella senegalensis TaxID=1468418 RepID=UPI0002D72C89|nr:MFS transporter [Bartonella senegalensis]